MNNRDIILYFILKGYILLTISVPFLPLALARVVVNFVIWSALPMALILWVASTRTERNKQSSVITQTKLSTDESNNQKNISNREE